MSDKDILDVNLNLDLLIDRVETIENHDIFKIWSSVRKGGKTTLDALIKNAQGIRELEKKVDVWIEGQKKYNRATGETIAELKEAGSARQTEKYKWKRVNFFIPWYDKKDSGGDDKCEECGGYRMGENMMHNDWCSQCTTTTTAEKLPEPIDGTTYAVDTTKEAEPEKDYVRFVRNYEGYWKSEYDKAIEDFIKDLESSLSFWNTKEHAKTGVVKDIIKKWQGRLKK